MSVGAILWMKPDGDDQDERKADRRPELVGDWAARGHEEIDDGEAQEKQPRRPAERGEQDVGEHGPDRVRRDSSAAD